MKNACVASLLPLYYVSLNWVARISQGENKINFVNCVALLVEYESTVKSKYPLKYPSYHRASSGT